MSVRRPATLILSAAIAAAALVAAPGSASAVTAYPDGSVDGPFTAAIGSGATGGTRVFSVAVQPDGRIVIGGIFTRFNGTPSAYVARLNTDGSLDTPFTTALGTGLNAYVTEVSVQPSGRVLLGGAFTQVNDEPAMRLARLGADGTPDSAFNAAVMAGGDSSGFNAEVDAIATQPDGKILVGGSFTSLNGVSRARLVRLNTDGSVDEAFSIALDGTTESSINDIALQPNGGILVASTYPRALIRLNPDGSLDTAFRDAQGSGFNGEVRSIALQSDGRIVVGGSFDKVIAPGPVFLNTGRIARLSTAGVVDTGFSAKASFDDTVNSVAVQSDDSLVVAGGVLATINTLGLRTLRLAPDGTVDTDFATNTGEGTDAVVHSVAIGPDGRAVLAGAFATINTVASDHVARLIGPAVNLSSAAPAIAPLAGGPMLTLRGSGFTGTPAVTVGGSPCTSPTRVNATIITCVLRPHAAGTVDVTVVNDSTVPGATLHLAQAVTYAATAPRQVGAGGDHSCALSTARQLQCWGDSGSTRVTIAPAGTFTQVSAGRYHSCALAVDASLACWGAGAGGTNFGQVTPPANGTYSQVSAGAAHSCAVSSTGSVTCWGSNTNGESNPPPGAFTQVSAGGDFNNGVPIGFTCGVGADSLLTCWGSSTGGRTAAPAGTYTKVAVGDAFACAVSTGHRLACWGADTNSVVSTAPNAQVTDVSAGAGYACTQLLNGSSTCWGKDSSGSTTSIPPYAHTSLSTGTAHSCAVDRDQQVQCWGSNTRGQIGYGVSPQVFATPLPLAEGTLSSAYGPGGAGVQLVVKDADQPSPTTYVAPLTRFAVTSGALPTGLALSATGLISGTPEAVGDSTFVVTSTSPFGSRTASFTVHVNPVSVTVTAASPPTISASMPVPAINYTTSPATTSADWTTQPMCTAYTAADTGFTTPLSGTQPSGTYVTHCTGGTSTRFTPSSYVNGSLTVDATAPTVSVSALPVSQMSLAFPVSWTATDSGAGVLSTDVRYRTALWSSSLPTTYTLWKSAVTARTATFTGSQGFTYCLSTRARDNVGNVSGWSVERCTTLPLDERTLATVGSWAKSAPTGWVATTALQATASGASLSTRASVSVKTVGLIALRCTTCGSVVVKVGTTLRTVSLVGTSAAGVRTLFTVTLPSRATGTLRISTTSAKKVRVDGIVLSRT